jgi:hypothetical protein
VSGQTLVSRAPRGNTFGPTLRAIQTLWIIPKRANLLVRWISLALGRRFPTYTRQASSVAASACSSPPITIDLVDQLIVY